MSKPKPIYLVFVPLLLPGVAGYFAINQNLDGAFRTATPTDTPRTGKAHYAGIHPKEEFHEEDS